MNKKVVIFSLVTSLFLIGGLFASAQNVKVIKNSSTIPKPPSSVCVKEIRLCSDGSQMLRDTSTCEWLAASCAPSKPASLVKALVSVTSLPSVQPIAESAPPTASSGASSAKIIPKITTVSAPDIFSSAKISSVVSKFNKIGTHIPSMSVGEKFLGSKKPSPSCTLEGRLCQNGLPMPRDKDCNWQPQKCSEKPVVEKIITQ